MKNQGFPITVFTKDDVITRIEPIGKDHSYVGDPLKLIGINNACVIVRVMGGPMSGDLARFPLPRWEEGWDMFSLPEGVTMEEYLTTVQ